MRVETKTYTNIVKIPQWYEIKGNESGSPVKTAGNHAGDGDINTGNIGGSTVEALLHASCNREGDNARLDFSFEVTTNEKNKREDLFFEATRYINLSTYSGVRRNWSYVTNKGEKATVNESFECKLCNHPSAFYWDYYSGKKGRKGYLAVNNPYPDWTSPQSWIPMENLGFQIDGSGNELYEVGKFGFKALVIISVQVTRTVKTTFENIVDDNAATILANDRKLSTLTLNGILNNRPLVTFEDGSRNFANNVIHDDGGTGAWLRGTREEQENVVTYTFPHSVTTMVPSPDYYLGAIILVDNNFRSAQPTKVVLGEAERKPLSMFATNTFTNQYFDGVRPTAKEMNNKRNDYIQNYLKKVTDQTKLPSKTRMEMKDFDSADGISIGGSIKGVDFGFTLGERTKKVRVYTFSQVLYSMSLDDTYKRGSEFFSDQLNVSEFKNAIKHYSPAIISNVDYGKVAYLAIASDDNSAMSVNITQSEVLSGTASIGKSAKNCTFKAIVLGGVAGSMNGTFNFSNLAEANDFLKAVCTEMTAKDVEAAIPIAFEAKFLRDPSRKVTTNIYKYFSRYVDKIKINLWEDNKGAKISARLRLIDYDYDSKGNRDYVFRYWNQWLDFEKDISPWACCIEIKYDVYGGDDQDFVVFIPYIPMSSLYQDDNGNWIFKVRIGGTTEYNAKNNIVPGIAIPGCYANSNNKYYRGDLAEGDYKGKSEDTLLTDYFNYCELMRATHDSFYRLSSEKTNKTCRGDD